MTLHSSHNPPPTDATERGAGRVVAELVAVSIRRPWVVIALAALITVLCGYVAATRFAITTETDQLIESDSPWARAKVAYEEAFPQLNKVILAVVEGDTPERTDAAAAALVKRLSDAPGGAIKAAWRPDAGPYFDRNGLLLLPLDQVRATLAGLEGQGALLQALSADPTLRGLSRLIALGAQQNALGENAGMLDRVSDIVERVLAGERPHLSWQATMSGRPPEPGDLRRFVLVDPILDYEKLEPASDATGYIRRMAGELGITPGNGLQVRLTGLAPLADEEFATVAEGAPLHLGLTVVAIAVILFLALRSGRVIAAVLITTGIGLVVTIGVGLLMVGRFNVISVAVAALFLGLGVDFGIQVAVRYRDERYKRDEVRTALLSAAHGIGWSLTLAALSLLAGFFAFLPTSFKGVSELGLITGVGMIIAFLASLTVLPALIAVMNPPGEPDSVETQGLAAIDHWIHRHRKLVIVSSAVLVLAGLPFLFRLEFDANPMHLRSDKTEAVATFLDLTRQPGMTPNTISILAPTVQEAGALAQRIAALPEVDRTVTVLNLVPQDQDAKIAAIRETAGRLPDIAEPRPPAPAPTDPEIADALRRAATALDGTTSDGAPGERLAPAFKRLADGTPAQRATAQEGLTGSLPGTLAKLSALLRPDGATLQTLPATIKDDWVATDGRARVEVSPKGDANDNAVLERFAAAVRTIAPNPVGGPVDVVESRTIIVHAFVTAGLLALGAIFVILTIALRKPFDVALTLGPLVIATILTLEAAHLLGMALNLANIIALPLMLAVGVNFHIYYMIAWRNGVADMLASSLTRAIFFSSLTTGVAFGSLWLSNHPGTASMGKLLTISLFFTLLAAFVIVPAFLGPPRQHRDTP